MRKVRFTFRFPFSVFSGDRNDHRNTFSVILIFLAVNVEAVGHLQSKEEYGKSKECSEKKQSLRAKARSRCQRRSAALSASSRGTRSFLKKKRRQYFRAPHQHTCGNQEIPQHRQSRDRQRSAGGHQGCSRTSRPGLNLQMTPAIDTNILVSLMDASESLNSAAAAGIEKASQGRLLICGAVHGELLAMPGRTEHFIDRYISALTIGVDWTINEAICVHVPKCPRSTSNKISTSPTASRPAASWSRTKTSASAQPPSVICFRSRGMETE